MVKARAEATDVSVTSFNSASESHEIPSSIPGCFNPFLPVSGVEAADCEV